MVHITGWDLYSLLYIHVLLQNYLICHFYFMQIQHLHDNLPEGFRKMASMSTALNEVFIEHLSNPNPNPNLDVYQYQTRRQRANERGSQT